MTIKILCKSVFCSYFLLLLFTYATAQVNVRFVVKQRPTTHAMDTIFIAGSFNTWSPSDNRCQFKGMYSDNPILDLQLLAGEYEYKLTRGSWNKVKQIKMVKMQATEHYILQKIL